jgi:hypothetical protein
MPKKSLAVDVSSPAKTSEAQTLCRSILQRGGLVLPRPVATYEAPVGRVFLSADLVHYRLVKSSGSPVVRISPDGAILAL